jgi:hypothetical protein
LRKHRTAGFSKEQEGKLDKQHHSGYDPGFSHKQSAAGSPQQIPEAEKITLKLSPVSAAPAAPDPPDQATADLPSQAACSEISQTSEHRTIEPGSEIHFDDLSPGDRILIETNNSFYSFTINEPKILAGRLIGGVLGNRLVNAALLPSWFAMPNLAPQSFKVGSRLVFMVEWGNNLRQLTTSVIIRLLHRTVVSDGLPAGEQEHWDLHESLVTGPLGDTER